MDRSQVSVKPNLYSFLITSLLLVNIATCMLIGIQIFKHINSSLADLNLPFYCTLFLAGNFLFIYGIRALISISQHENHSASDNSLPEKIQEAVSGLKTELVDIVLTRKEFNKIHLAINHCTTEIVRFEKELFQSVMDKLNDLNMEANQKTGGLEEQKKALVSQIVGLLETAERWEKILNEANPDNQFKPTSLIKDAEKLITGLKVICPLPKDEFIPENHSANQIPLGSNPLKIESCNSRGYIFGDKVYKKAEVILESLGN
jgi:hypothetical protein